MTNTENYGFIIPEGTDKVNLLTQNNPNWESADGIIKGVEDKSIGIATELLTSTVHALTRNTPDSAVFRFTATSNYTAGETFTVDGVQVTALLPSGEPLGNNSYIIGAEVICCLKATLLTFYLTTGVVSTAKDSEKLGGELPSYYAKQSDLNQTNNVAEAAGTLATQNQQSITVLTNNLTASDNLKFRFVTDGEGNYGYLGADDSFIPFKKGLTLKTLGGAGSYNLSSYEGYKDFAINKNIFIVASGSGTSHGGTGGFNNVGGYVNFATPSASYNASTGILNVSNGYAQGAAWNNESNGTHALQSKTITATAYLVY